MIAMLTLSCAWPWVEVLGGRAHAYESDQLTAWVHPPADALDAANARADELLTQAVLHANDVTDCAADDDETRLVLTRAIRAAMGERTVVKARGRQPALVFGAYAAWLEAGPVDRVSYADRGDLYGDIPWIENPILRSVGPASTVRLDTVLVGTDKIDHFWVQGFDYFRASRGGEDEEAAIDWGTKSELGRFGLFTTGVFSYGDLAANYAGFQFYDSVLRDDGLFERGADGCVVQAREFDWREWIDWRVDEVLNPSVYTEQLRPGLEERIRAACDGAPGLTTAQKDELSLELESIPVYASSESPLRSQTLDLTDLCPRLVEP